MRKRIRIVVVVLLLLLAIVACRYGYARFASGVGAIAIESKGATAGGSERPRSLRIATWNIAHGRGPEPNASNWGGDTPERRRRLEQIGELLRLRAVELVVLNEVDFSCVWSGHVDQAAIVAEAGGFPYVVRQRNFDFAVPFARWQFGNAILSRHPILSATRETFPPRSPLEAWLAGNHDSALAYVELPGGVIIAVWACHLEHRDAATRRSAAEVIVDRAIRVAEPLFLVGDFNSSPRNMTGRISAPAVNTLMGSAMFGHYPGPREAGGTFPAPAPTRTIDWIFHPPDWHLVGGEIVDSQLSDHRPVIAEVALPQPQQP